MRNIIATLLIKSINPRIKVNTCYGEGSAFDNATRTIHLNLADTECADLFLRHLAIQHKCSFVNEFPIELWTILHEIGHYYTEDFYNSEIDYLAREAIRNLKPSDFAENDGLPNAYFDLRSEWLATEWAIQYAKKHPLKCLIFGDLLR